jgi:type I restriction enzyme M protein
MAWDKSFFDQRQFVKLAVTQTCFVVGFPLGLVDRPVPVVANPPFSFKAWSNGFDPGEDEFERFEYGIPPSKNGDYAFLLHILKSLNSTGKAAVNLPHGVLFRGNVEAVIRKEIVRRGYIKGIIGLPANLFYGTGIPACILVLDKENAATRKGIFMIDASKGFIKDGNKNRLRAQDIHKIVDTFSRQIKVPRYSRMVQLAEISDPKNDFNLNLPRYIDSTEPEDLQNIEAHIRGGIPNGDIDALGQYWQVFPGLKATLFGSADRFNYSNLKVSLAEIKAVVFGHAELTTFTQSVVALFNRWPKANTPFLKGIGDGEHPKTLKERISEDLLENFRQAQLVDPYDVYQHLMDYWSQTMQDWFFHKDFCERLLNQCYFMRVALSVQTAIGRPLRSATAIILVPLPRWVLPTPRRGFRVGTDSGRRFLKRQ